MCFNYGRVCRNWSDRRQVQKRDRTSAASRDQSASGLSSSLSQKIGQLEAQDNIEVSSSAMCAQHHGPSCCMPFAASRTVVRQVIITSRELCNHQPSTNAAQLVESNDRLAPRCFQLSDATLLPLLACMAPQHAVTPCQKSAYQSAYQSASQLHVLLPRCWSISWTPGLLQSSQTSSGSMHLNISFLHWPSHACNRQPY